MKRKIMDWYPTLWNVLTILLFVNPWFEVHLSSSKDHLEFTFQNQ